MTFLRTLRGQLAAVALLGTLLAVAAPTIAFNLLLGHSLDADANRALRTQAAAARTTVLVRAGRLTVNDSADDEAIDHRVWIFQGTRSVERPAAEAALQRAADRLAGSATGYHDLGSPASRVFVLPITDRGVRVGTVVTAESLEPYRRTRDFALFGSLALAFVLLAAIFALMWAIIARALGPVREMTRSAAEWSEHDPSRRFGVVPRPDELGDLARTFDALLDRVAASVRHEQRLSAELSHELRTPLARISGEIELLQRRPRDAAEQQVALDAVARSIRQMQEILDTLMAAARAEAGLDSGRCDVVPVLERLVSPEPGEHVSVALDAPPRLLAGVDAVVLERALAPLLENARRFAREHVTITAERGDGNVAIAVADDGPGIQPDDLERVFQPGVSLDTSGGHVGAGLGLPLARRLIRAAGGDVHAVGASPEGTGAVMHVTLPQ